MEIDRTGLEVLSAGECLRLLATAKVGRLALNIGALPVVVPVAFVLTDDGILVRAGRGSDVDLATCDAVVGFEVDDIDADTGAGWSVLVTGMASHIEDVDLLARARLRAALGQWAGLRADKFIRISLGMLAGRRSVAGGPILPSIAAQRTAS